MKRIVIFGASGHARVVADIVNREGICNIVGYIANVGVSSDHQTGISILGGDDELPEIMRQYDVNLGIIAVGDNFRRSLIHNHITNQFPNFEFVSAIHPGAWVSPEARIGAGSVVMAGAIINPGSTIGSSCIVNTGATLDHDSRMKNFSSLAPGVVTGGNVEVGECSAVCIGAVVKHGLKIGEHSVVGAGSIVMRDVPPLSICYGQPCRFVRPREAGGRYL
jgi:sugar O-acyltransferase (sialic acid O-acetyltransferase NeuD family)